MKRSFVLCAMLLVATAALADWTPVASGVDYQHFTGDRIDVHVTRIDLTNPEIRVITTRESDRGMTVSGFAKKNKALAAINADYFDDKMKPVGLAISPCGVWTGSKDTEREAVVAVGEGRAEIYPPKDVLSEPADWMSSAVSGWPMIVKSCTPLTSTELPGSDNFTRTPHPRTAVGLSKDGTTLFLLVADGRREGVPGMTLAKLARFMAEELGACAAVNLDGGGSSAMWVGDAIVNQPSDKVERRVADHLAVIRAEDFVPCDPAVPPPPSAAPATQTSAAADH